MDVYLGHAFEEFVKTDSFTVMGKGLGALDLVARAVKLYCNHSIVTPSSNISGSSSGSSGEGSSDSMDHNSSDIASSNSDTNSLRNSNSDVLNKQSPPMVSAKKGLVFVLNLKDERGDANDKKVDLLMHILEKDGVSPLNLPKVITAENFTTTERTQLYKNGGCFIVTSRILIVDLLESCNISAARTAATIDMTAGGLEREAAQKKLLDITSITGLLICNAHKINENSTEAFIARVYRDYNKTGFIKAITDDPVAINNGEMRNIEVCMKCLYLSKLSLWPRSHPLIERCLSLSDDGSTEGSSGEVESLDIKLSKLTSDIQSSLLVALKQSIHEIKQSTKVDLDKNIEKYISADQDATKGKDNKANNANNYSKINSSANRSNSSTCNKGNSNSNSNNSKDSVSNGSVSSLDFALSRNFDFFVKSQLQQAGINSSNMKPKLKMLLRSIKEIRDLLDKLLLYDSPGFYNELLVYNKQNKEVQHESLWMTSEAGNRVYAAARDRVFKIEIAKESGHSSSSFNNSKKAKVVDTSSGDAKAVLKSNDSGARTVSERIPENVLDRLHRELEIPAGTRLIPIGEVNNKLRAFFHIIESELKREDTKGSILVVVKDRQTSNQLQIALEMLDLEDNLISTSSNSNSNSSSSSSSMKKKDDKYLEALRAIADDNYRRFISHQCADFRRRSSGLGIDRNNSSSSSSSSANSNSRYNGHQGNASGLKRSSSAAGKIDLATLMKGSGEQDSDIACNATSGGGRAEDIILDGLLRLIEDEEEGRCDSSSVSKYIYEKVFSMSKQDMMHMSVDKKLTMIEEFKLKNTKVKRPLEGVKVRRPFIDDLVRGDSEVDLVDFEVDENADRDLGDDLAKKTSRLKGMTDKHNSFSSNILGSSSNSSSLANNLDSSGGSEWSAQIVRDTRNGVNMDIPGGVSSRCNGGSSSSNSFQSRHVVIVTHDNAYYSNNIVMDVSPSTIILYDIDMSVVRNVEVYQALLYRQSGDTIHSSSSSSSSTNKRANLCKVFSLIYVESSEQFRYVSQGKKEKKMFESLNDIKDSLCVLLPDSKKDIERARKEDSLFAMDSRSAYKESIGIGYSGTQSIKTLIQKYHEKPIVVVDMREFRCDLPHRLYTKGFRVIPNTIVVADYVISTAIGIERKAIDDLFQSFFSGRLYTQVENLCRHYSVPVLLIEFHTNQPFYLQLESDIPAELKSSNISSMISILLLQFPSLRILWSRCSSDTSNILYNLLLSKDFESLNKKENIEEVLSRGASVGAAASSGLLDNIEVIDSIRDVLLSIPGINLVNIKVIMEQVASISDLAQRDESDLAGFVGKINAKQIFRFFRQKNNV